jgi:hypothetical protein
MATPGPATDDGPQTPKGVPEDVMEESEEEPEMAPEPVPEVVSEEVPAEGAMIAVHAAAPSPSHGALAPSSPVPRIAAGTGDVSDAGLEVVLGHPTPYASDGIPLGKAVSIAHRAMFLVQHVLRREGEDLADVRRRLQLWASMLKRMMVLERAAAQARQHGFNLQVQAITQRDADSKRALANMQELYASTEARASAIIKQEEDLIVEARQVN